MLIKMMKHDFRYSAKTFFVLATIAVIILAIFAATQNMNQFQQMMYVFRPQMFYLYWLATQFSNAFVTIVTIIVIAQIAFFYRKSMFGHFGHLAMTMPVSRGTLLASKLAVSFVWFFLYAALATLAINVMIAIMWPIMFPLLIHWNFFHIFRIETLAALAHTSAIAFATIALLFFCITLAHSALAGVRLRGIISGAIGFLYAWLYVITVEVLASRFFSDGTEFFHGFPYGLRIVDNPPLVGLQYGRIVIGQSIVGHPVYIDIFFVAFTLAAAAIAIAATHYLLKRRISLQ